MVNKFCWREVKRKLVRAKAEPPHARLFSEPGCRARASAWYHAYRWLVFLAWLAIIVCSALELGSHKPQGNNRKWPIYLTNWDLALGATQALIGALLVARRRRRRERLDDPRLGAPERLYWFLYTVTATLAVGVTVAYWCTVYDPRIHQVDPLNVMLHVGNSILMLGDFCVVAIPHRFKHCWWCLATVMTYLVFTVVYYLAGGLDKLGTHRIYAVLDWERPLRTLPICAGGLIFLVVVHWLLCLLARLRDRLYGRRDGNGEGDPSAATVRSIEMTV